MFLFIYDTFPFCSIRFLIHDLEDISRRRITEEEITKVSGVATDVSASVAFSLKVLSGASPKLSFPLRSIIKEEDFRLLVNSKNASTQAQVLFALLESTVQLPPPVRDDTSFNFSIKLLEYKFKN